MGPGGRGLGPGQLAGGSRCAVLSPVLRSWPGWLRTWGLDLSAPSRGPTSPPPSPRSSDPGSPTASRAHRGRPQEHSLHFRCYCFVVSEMTHSVKKFPSRPPARSGEYRGTQGLLRPRRLSPWRTGPWHFLCVGACCVGTPLHPPGLPNVTSPWSQEAKGTVWSRPSVPGATSVTRTDGRKTGGLCPCVTGDPSSGNKAPARLCHGSLLTRSRYLHGAFCKAVICGRAEEDGEAVLVTVSPKLLCVLRQTRP